VWTEEADQTEMIGLSVVVKNELSTDNKAFLPSDLISKWENTLATMGKASFAERVRFLVTTYEDLSEPNTLPMLQQKIAQWAAADLDIIGDLSVVLTLKEELKTDYDIWKAEQREDAETNLKGEGFSSSQMTESRINEWIIRNNKDEYRQRKRELNLVDSIIVVLEKFIKVIEKASDHNATLSRQLSNNLGG
jgi:hypothetical protein